MISEYIEDPNTHPCIYLFYAGGLSTGEFQPLYVGSSTTPRARKNTHLRNLRNGNHPNKRLQRWVDDNGLERLKWTVLEFLVSYDEMNRSMYRPLMRVMSEDEYRDYIVRTEQKHIEVYRPQGLLNYNDAVYSSWRKNAGSRHSTATKRKMSESTKRSYGDSLRGLRSSQNESRWSHKTLVFGDIHLDTTIIPRVERLFIEGNYDRLVFLGDEMDSFHLDYKNAAVVLSQLRTLKDKHNKHHRKFIWIAGNHTMSYLTDFHCSGFDRSLFNQVHDELLELHRGGYIDPFYRYHGVLFSHAGFTNNWIRQVDAPDKERKLKVLLNMWFDGDFSLFNQVGFARGGVGFTPSCMWADKTELLRDPLQSPPGKYKKRSVWKQVVGHTPVQEIESYIGDHLWFCDTFSTYRDGAPIGDQTVLEIVDGEEFKKIKL